VIWLPPKRLPLRSVLDAATLCDATGTKYAPGECERARQSAMNAGAFDPKEI
jgi:hypothetical protein